MEYFQNEISHFRQSDPYLIQAFQSATFNNKIFLYHPNPCWSTTPLSRYTKWVEMTSLFWLLSSFPASTVMYTARLWFLFSRPPSLFSAERHSRFCRWWYHWKAHPWKHIGRHQNYVPILSDSWDTRDASFTTFSSYSKRVKCGNFRMPISALYPLWTSALLHSALPQFTHALILLR